ARSSCSRLYARDAAPTEIYTLSLHDALPIFQIGITASRQDQGLPLAVGEFFGYKKGAAHLSGLPRRFCRSIGRHITNKNSKVERSEEHTSELQSRENLVCRLLLEKKKKE